MFSVHSYMGSYCYLVIVQMLMGGGGSFSAGGPGKGMHSRLCKLQQSFGAYGRVSLGISFLCFLGFLAV